MIQTLAQRLWENGHFNVETARRLFAELRGETQ
jgi:hypothetical protein